MKRVYKIACIILIVGIVVFLALFLPKLLSSQPAPKGGQEGDRRGTGEGLSPSQSPPSQYQSPIDFAALQSKNEDIYGWLEIPGTNISYPVVQNAQDDTYYLNHNENKKSYVGGALFTEHKYNSKDFQDKVVAIYGHHLTNGKMFGDLQKYYTDNFDKYKDIIIYTPKEEIHYQAFAAVSFSNRHILYYYDCFKDDLMMQEFLDDLSSVRAIGSYVDKTVKVTTKDQLIVLSTCLQGDRTCRFLVVGKRID